MPSIESLDKKRIDVLIPYDIIGKDDKKETVLRWCQGKVKEVYDQEERPFTVQVEWDPTPDINGGEESVETDQVLKKHLWNKNKKIAWRMDINVDIGNENEETEQDDDNIESESDGDSKNES